MPSNDSSKKLNPWRWAGSFEACWLFWLPVQSGTIPDFQREWLLEFFSHFSSRMKSLSDLDDEIFMQMKVINADLALKKSFINAMLKESPLSGASHFPGQTDPPVPATPTLKESQAIASGKSTFDPSLYMPDTACWFINGKGTQLRQKYLGYGGMTMLYIKPDSKEGAPPPVNMTHPLIIPKVLRNDPRLKPILQDFDPNDPTKIPSFLKNHPGMKKVFSLFDVESERNKPARLSSHFLDRSKEIFGAGMEHDLMFEAQPFILPRLSSTHFFSHTPPEVRRWFEVFDVYVSESAADGGIIMACKDNLTSLIEDIMEEMRSDGFKYWEG